MLTPLAMERRRIVRAFATEPRLHISCRDCGSVLVAERGRALVCMDCGDEIPSSWA